MSAPTLEDVLKAAVREAVREEIGPIRSALATNTAPGPDPLQMLTVDQVAELMCCTPETVLAWRAKGRLRATLVSRRWLVKRSDLQAFIDNGAGSEDAVPDPDEAARATVADIRSRRR